MKLKINTELEISEDGKNVCDVFGITAKEVANHVDFYFKHETLIGWSDIIVELIKDNRLDIICTLATAYLKVTDKSLQPPDVECRYPCPECGQTGRHFFNCNGTGKVKS